MTYVRNRMGYFPCFVVGGLLVALGVFHLPVHYLSDQAWEGNTSWRKPILFGLSTGVTLLSIEWVLSQLRFRPSLKEWLSSLLAYTSLLEVGLITVQTWRRIPAHFNISQPSNLAVSFTIEICLFVLLGGITYITVQCVRQFKEPNNSQYAIKLGMQFLALGCYLGLAHVVYGYWMVSQGNDPHLVPPAGLPKFAHGMPIHAIQILPAVNFLSKYIGMDEKTTRSILVHFVVLIFTATAYAVVQTVCGKARFDPVLLSYALLAVFCFTASNCVVRVLWAKLWSRLGSGVP